MNILQIMNDACLGGAEVHTRLITKAMSKLGHRITFVYGPGPYAEKYAELKVFGVECIELEMKKNPLKSVLFIRKLIKQRNIQLIHSHMHWADFLAFVSRIGLSVRHITTIHFLPYRFAGLLFRTKIVVSSFIAFVFMEKLFTVSVADAVGLKRRMLVPGRKITVLKNSIDFDEMQTSVIEVKKMTADLKPSDLSRVVMCTGNLIPHKGHAFLVDAMRILSDKNPGLKLVLLGRGPEEDRLREQASQAGINDRVVFAGHRKNVPDWLSVADVYVQPSLIDPMPRALLEAMYMALPVVVSDIENLRETVKNGVNGIVVPVRSSAALASAVQFLLDNKPEAVRMGNAAKTYVQENCSMDAMARRICGIL
jgi:glycosyltransferase involved in cell wall biosynthesis